MEIVGIVADIHEGGLANNAVPELYLPSVVHPPKPRTWCCARRSESAALRRCDSKGRLAVDRDQPISDIKAMEPCSPGQGLGSGA